MADDWTSRFWKDHMLDQAQHRAFYETHRALQKPRFRFVISEMPIQSAAMVLKSRIRFISPAKWFPADDATATVVARLCVLREDLYIELLGVAAEAISLSIPMMESPLPNMDDNGDAYRRLYFMRASLPNAL